MSKKKSVYGFALEEAIGWGTTGLIAGQMSSLSGDSTPMTAFRIGSSLAGVPTLLKTSKSLFDAWKF